MVSLTFDRETAARTKAEMMRRSRGKDFEFVGVDGEGAGKGEDHKYVLLGCGEEFIEDIDGIGWEMAFSFLYSCFQKRPTAAFVGFFLGYDFTQILKTLPEDRAIMLLTDRGMNARRRKSSGGNTKPFPVRYANWEFDMLPGRRLQIRPQTCNCSEKGRRNCEHTQFQWMYICDSGPFWQTSLLNVINPKNWKYPIVSDAEYTLIEQGKANRSLTIEEYLEQRERVIKYNQLENAILARAMNELMHGFNGIGVNLRKNQWFGPGQAAAAWFKKNGVPRRDEIEKAVHRDYLEAARKSYFGGWFEIFSHGIIPGMSHEYDINSAYPYIIANLPCLLHGRYSSGTGKPPIANGKRYTLLYCRATGSNPYIGAMLNRSREGRIRRPYITEGWYWQHEIEAAEKAGLIDKFDCKEWQSYDSCDCSKPLRGFRDLYDHRLRVGKESILGKGAKLCYNSGYGKFAQSTGSSPYGNWVYASLITAGCREMILNAISTHPNGTKSVLMVATDGIFFDNPHPDLPTSKKLGEWDYTIRENLTLFKPGVYWDDATRVAIRNGKSIGFKARGVNARDFARTIGKLDLRFLQSINPHPEFRFRLYRGELYRIDGEVPWPSIQFPVGFTLVSAKTALNRGDWKEAGATYENIIVIQDSDPNEKRWHPYFDAEKNRIRTRPMRVAEDEIVTEPYQKRYGLEDPFSLDTQESMGMSQDGTVTSIMQMYARMLAGRE
jgi:hypothetical protein